MDQRLEEAAHAGDVDVLHQLLEQDRLLLHRPNATSHPSDNPLHVAASLGHSEFAREILIRNADLARAANGQGLYPLHLASANGHVPVVKELLLAVGPDLCLLQDKDGLLPIHNAAINGRVRALEELISASPESARFRTCLGDTILHLAVKFNCFEAVEFLVEKLEQQGDHEFVMSRDAKGNTILHIATARKQLKIIKLLLSKPWTNVNAVNSKGSTILDVLLESPCEHGDLMLGEMIRAAGGRISVEGDDQIQQPSATSSDVKLHSLNEGEGTARGRISVEKDDQTQQPSVASLEVMPSTPIEGAEASKNGFICKFLTLLLASVGLGYLVSVPEVDYGDYYKDAPNTLIIVATLIATVTFQGGLNPPGGFAQQQDQGTVIDKEDQGSPSPPLKAGQAVISDQLFNFVMFDIIALLASLSVILMMLCLVPKSRGVIRFMMWMTCLAVFFMGFAFDQSIFIIFPSITDVFYLVWFAIVSIFAIWLCLRFIVYVLKRIRFLNKQPQAQNGEQRLISFSSWTSAGAAIFLAIATTGTVIFYMFWIELS